MNKQEMRFINVLALYLIFCAFSCAQKPPPPEPAVVSADGEKVDTGTVPKTDIHIFKNPQTNLGRGIKDGNTGEILLEPIYDFIEEKVPGFYTVKGGKEKYGIYELKKRKITIPVVYRYVSVNLPADSTNSKKPIFIVRLPNDKYGYIDHTYKTFLDVPYDGIEYHEIALLVHKDKKVGINFLDENVKDIPIEYDQIENVGNNKFNALKDTIYTLFDKDGTVIFDKQLAIFPLTGRWEPYHTNIIFVANKNKKIGVYDVTKEEMAIPQNYERIVDFCSDYFIIEQHEKFGVIDKNNEIKIPVEYDSIGFLNPGVGGERAENVLILVSKNKKFGLMNRRGVLIVPIEYDEVAHIFGYYKVKIKNEYFILDPSGKKITKLGFDEVGGFYNGKCAVFKDGKIGYLKGDGRFVEKFRRKLSPQGFKNLDDQFEQFVVALKSEDDAQLQTFCKKMVPGEYTIEFMKRTNLSFMRFPQTLNETFTLDKVTDQYYQELKSLRMTLKSKGELASLTYQAYPDMNSYIRYLKVDEINSVLFIEFYGGFTTDKQAFKYRLGKMMFVDGFCKSFSRPKRSIYNSHFK